MKLSAYVESKAGQVMVLAPILFLAIVAFLALAVDVGSIAVEKARLQNGADAAVLAAAGVLTDEHRDGAAEADARAAATAAAQSLLEANVPGGRLGIQYGVTDADGTFTEVGTGTPATTVKATGARDEAAPGGPLALVFAGVLGINSCDLSAAAAAETSGRVTAVLGGLAPFAVPRDRIPAIGQEFAFYPASSGGKGKGGGQTEPGNWGLLDLNGGSNDTSDLVNWIENGYPGIVSIDDDLGFIWIDGDSGWRAALEGALQDKLGQPLMVSVYDEVTGNGSNAEYRVIGFLRLTLTYADLTGKDAQVRGRVAGLITMHNIVVSSGGWESPNMRKLQLIE
jgi:hypothetical protein